MFANDAYQIIDYQMDRLGLTWARRIDGNTIKFRHNNKWTPALNFHLVSQAFDEIAEETYPKLEPEQIWLCLISDSNLTAE